MDEMNKEGGRCGCFHHKIVPATVLLFGLMFLVHNAFGWLSEGFVMVAWPILVVVAGVFKFGNCKCCPGGACGPGGCC